MTGNAGFWTRRDVMRTVTGMPTLSALDSLTSIGGEFMSSDSVLELRQYTLRSGRRAELISLFESQFVAPLNAAGACVRGTFRDLDDPDRFVWIRGFVDMPARGAALEAFYNGKVWQAHKAAANSTMIDSGNVLLLQPIRSDAPTTAPPSSASGASGIYSATIYYLNGTESCEVTRFFESTMRPRLLELGAYPLMCLETERAANNFPRLPVRELESVFVWIARWQGSEHLQAFQRRWVALSGWRDEAPESVLPALMRKPELLRLAPTALSAMR